MTRGRPAGAARGRARIGVGVLAILLLVPTACGPFATSGPGCRPVRSGVALPDAIRESSGVAVSLRHPGIYWTHNDAGSVLFGVDRDGTMVARFAMPVRLRDWEDVALASCSRGGSCLWAADVGDNYEERHDIKLVRLPEPAPTADSLAAADVYPIRLPDGPRDIEALLVLPGERVLLVTKGRNDPVTVYRYPPPFRADTVTLEEVQRLTDGPRVFPRQVSGGAVSPGGDVLALRTYESLRFYRLEGDTLAELEDGLVNLRPLEEPQGEGVGIGLGGEVALTSEGGPGGGPGSIRLLRCDVDAG